MPQSTLQALLAIAVLSIAPEAATATQPASKTFRDWVAACDNVNSCTALSLPSELAEDIGFLKIERRAGPAAAAALSIRIRSETMKAPLSARLSLDGAAFPAAGQSLPASLADDETATVALSAADAEALITAARKATKLSVALAGKTYEISLAGAVAAMLWLDERQGRLNTATALIRKGAAPSAAVPAASALPVVIARPTAALPSLDAKAAKALTADLRRHLKRLDPEACEENDAGMPNADQLWSLDGGQRLVGLLCSRGAYNLTTGFWIVPGGDVAKARKVAFPQLDGSSDNTLINADYAPKTGQIGYFAKARGIGDCGANGGYAWTGSGFAMTALSEMGECRGLPPGDWLTLYRSEVKLAK